MKHFLFLSSIVLLMACQKTEGPGGQASVSGKIFVRDYNDSFTQLIDSYFAMEQRVYLVYGDDSMYGEEIRTHYDGSFRFDFLTKGKYTVYVYSKDSTFTIPGGQYPLKVEFEITDKKEEVDLGTLTILD
jgi:hypothetical protein